MSHYKKNILPIILIIIYLSFFHVCLFADKQSGLEIRAVTFVKFINTEESIHGGMLSPTYLAVKSHYNNTDKKRIGELIVNDAGNKRILFFDYDGDCKKVISNIDIDPTGIALASSIKYIFGDKYDNALYSYHQVKEELKRIRLNIELFDPMGMDIDVAGNIYLADSGNDRVLKLMANGEILMNIRNYDQSGSYFDTPYDVAVNDGNDNIYIADYGNDRIGVFNSLGEEIKAMESIKNKKVSRPEGIAVDEQNLYLSNTGNNEVIIYDYINDKMVRVLRDFEEPIGIALSKIFNKHYRYLYVADRYKNRISVYMIKYSDK